MLRTLTYEASCQGPLIVTMLKQNGNAAWPQIHELISQIIFLIIIHIIQFQKLLVLLGKRTPFVMLFLVLYVVNRGLHCRLANGKCRIASLPWEHPIMRGYCFYPTAAVALHHFYDVGHVLILRQDEQHMDMIFCTTRPYIHTSACIHQLANVCVNTLQILLFNSWTDILDMENQVDI